MKRASALGASTTSRQLPAPDAPSSTCSNATTVPTPSTCPCDEVAAQAVGSRSDFSRFTSPSGRVRRCSAASRRTRRTPSVAPLDRDDRQAAAVDRDAVADRDVGEVERAGSPRRGAGRRPWARRRPRCPTACTIPVNISASCCAIRAHDAQVVADTCDVVQRRAAMRSREVRECRRGTLAHAARRIADDRRCEIEQQLVDEPAREQRAVEPGAGLDVQLVDRRASRARASSRARSTRPFGIRQRDHFDAARPRRHCARPR